MTISFSRVRTSPFLYPLALGELRIVVAVEIGQEGLDTFYLNDVLGVHLVQDDIHVGVEVRGDELDELFSLVLLRKVRMLNIEARLGTLNRSLHLLHQFLFAVCSDPYHLLVKVLGEHSAKVEQHFDERA